MPEKSDFFSEPSTVLSQLNLQLPIKRCSKLKRISSFLSTIWGPIGGPK